MNALYVICKIGEVEYAIPASEVFQMESYSTITPVPGALPFVAGLIQIRHQVMPVVDARARLGLEAQAPTADSRFVVLKLATRLVALLVDSAREVRRFSEDEFTDPPELIAKQTHGLVKSVVQIKERIILLIDGLKVVAEET